MRWPWTSRARLDDALALVERAREEMRARLADAGATIASLGEQNARLIDSLTRVTRASNGLAEVPHEPRKPAEEIPVELVKIVSGFGNEALRKRIYQVALSRHARGESWQVIIAEAKKSTVEGL
jgi:hypothetical protein